MTIGIWSATTAYTIGDIVQYNNHVFEALLASTGVVPTLANATTWKDLGALETYCCGPVCTPCYEPLGSIEVTCTPGQSCNTGCGCNGGGVQDCAAVTACLTPSVMINLLNAALGISGSTTPGQYALDIAGGSISSVSQVTGGGFACANIWSCLGFNPSAAANGNYVINNNAGVMTLVPSTATAPLAVQDYSLVGTAAPVGTPDGTPVFFVNTALPAPDNLYNGVVFGGLMLLADNW